MYGKNLHDEGIKIDIGSDQTSLHNPWAGGYYPAGYTFEESNRMMRENPEQFREAVRSSLRRQVEAINSHTARAHIFLITETHFFWRPPGQEPISLKADGEFRYPSYVQDIMGPLCFDFGFGPFRWICCSNDPADLAVTDRIAGRQLKSLAGRVSGEIKMQLSDNIHWIEQPQRNNLVVGSQARILYADSEGRIAIAEAFNNAIAKGRYPLLLVIGRDHHDVSGTDSPYRETSNIYDGSKFTSDMAVQNVIGDSFRGATWVSLHNGGGVGWGEVINGGFGMVARRIGRCSRKTENDAPLGCKQRYCPAKLGQKRLCHCNSEERDGENPRTYGQLPEYSGR